MPEKIDKLPFRRQLRREQSDAERKLWSMLRSRQLQVYKFRRQHSIGPYTVDFCCLERRLIIELDGGQHADQVAYDAKRTGFLEAKGFKVLRFWDNEFLKETSAVMEKILVELEMRPLARSPRAEVYGWRATDESKPSR